MKVLSNAALACAIACTATFPAFALDIEAPTLETRQTRAIHRIPLLPGENSFTENQARERIEKTGFTNVSSLQLDDRGIWRGKAVKGSVPMDVGLDFKGNVAAQ